MTASAVFGDRVFAAERSLNAEKLTLALADKVRALIVASVHGVTEATVGITVATRVGFTASKLKVSLSALLGGDSLNVLQELEVGLDFSVSVNEGILLGNASSGTESTDVQIRGRGDTSAETC